MPEKICLIVGTKNEAPALPRFFEHHSWADEILVMDSFSTDGTIELCKKYGHGFCQAELAGNANIRHNLALTLFKSDWAFFLDPDEFVSDELKRQILEFLVSPKNEYAAYEFRRINYFMGRPLYHGGWSGNTLRIFRKNSVVFKGDAYHDHPTVTGKTGFLSGVIYHYACPNIYWVLQKFNYISEFDVKDYYNKFGVLPEKKFKRLLFTRPLKNFWKGYVKKRGYRDGLYGFIYAAMIWAFDVIRICKYGEKYIIKNPDILAPGKLSDPWECRK